MYSFTGNDIELTRGDSLCFEITFAGRALVPAAQAVFTLKKRVRDTAALIEKTCAIVDGKTTVELTPEETDLTPGTYWWDVRVLTPEANGTDVRTPMEYAAFQITISIHSSV